MIQVIITRQNGNYKSFICSGHADFQPDRGFGRFLRPQGDVVCAGVSAIVINTVNCLQDLLHEDLITCAFRSIPTHEASLLIDSMIHGLEWIRSEYGERYLKFEIEEV